MGMGNNLFSERVKPTTIGLFKYFDEPYLFCASKTAIKRIQMIRKAKGL